MALNPGAMIFGLPLLLWPWRLAPGVWCWRLFVDVLLSLSHLVLRLWVWRWFTFGGFGRVGGFIGGSCASGEVSTARPDVSYCFWGPHFGQIMFVLKKQKDRWKREREREREKWERVWERDRRTEKESRRREQTQRPESRDQRAETREQREMRKGTHIPWIKDEDNVKSKHQMTHTHRDKQTNKIPVNRLAKFRSPNHAQNYAHLLAHAWPSNELYIVDQFVFWGWRCKKQKTSTQDLV